MKLFTKEIDTKLFEQYLTGSDLENQMVVAKIFNPYGRGTWYLLNSDPEDPEYLWAIVDMDDIEVGSVNRSDLENIRIKPFMLGLERDLSFRQMNALELYEGLNEGKKYIKGGGVEKANFGYLLIADKMKNLAPKSFDAVDEKFAERIKIGMYADGGGVEAENKEMVLNNNNQIAHHTKEISAAVKNAKNVPAWVVAKVNRSASDLSDATHYMEGQGESYADGGGVDSIKITKNEFQFRKDEPKRVYHSYEGTLGDYIFYAETDNSFKSGYGSYGINKGSIYKLSIRKVLDNGMHNSIAEYSNKWDYRTKNAKDGAIRSKIIKYIDSISDEKKGTPKKYKQGGGVGITESDIIEGVSFKNKSGTIFVIDKIELDPRFGKLVSSSLLGGKKGNYRDGIDDFIAFLNEEKAIKYETGGEVESKLTGWKHKKKKLKKNYYICNI
jgi:hypothetical protein